MHYNNAIVVFHFLVAKGKVKKGKREPLFCLAPLQWLSSQQTGASWITFQILSPSQRSPDAMLTTVKSILN